MPETRLQDETETLRRGLYFLLRESVNHKVGLQPVRRVVEPVGLHRHPFGLSLPALPTAPFSNMMNPIQFVGDAGVTDVSITNFARLIAQELAEYHWNMGPKYLRVIRLGTEIPLVLFEIGLENVIYICGGCTDNKGSTGGRGYDTLMALFYALSQIFGLEIQSVTIVENAETERRTLEREIDAARASGQLNTCPLES